MNILIIFVLLFTFSLKVNVTANGNTNASETSNASCSENVSNQVISTVKPVHIGRSTLNQSERPHILDLRMMLTFLLGMIFSTTIFTVVLVFAIICNRCRTTDTNTDKESIILEAVKSEHDQSVRQSDDDQANEQDRLEVQAPVEVSTNTSLICSVAEEEMKILEKEQTEGAGEVNEVDYASINYSLLQKKDRDLKPQKMESDYAEIQLKKQSEGEDAEMDGENQHEVKQDGVDQGLGVGMESLLCSN